MDREEKETTLRTQSQADFQGGYFSSADRRALESIDPTSEFPGSGTKDLEYLHFPAHQSLFMVEFLSLDAIDISGLVLCSLLQESVPCL